jgi:hypothetical protein
MFGWLKKRPPRATLHFKDSLSAFAFACETLSSEISSGAVLSALVLDASEETGEGPAVKRESDGNQTAILKVCSSDGGFTSIAGSASPNGPTLRPGDLVSWRAIRRVEGRGVGYGDERSEWIGMILARLKPEYEPGRGWAIELPFSN